MPRCRVPAGLIAAALCFHFSQAQTVRYDVSTIKPHSTSDPGVWWNQQPDGLRFTNVTAKALIAHAWDVRPDQITGEPAWADDARWDRVAKSTEGSLQAMSYPQRNEMLRVLLVERLRVKVHMETRSGTVFRLLPAKGGVKLKPLIEQAVESDSKELKPGNLSWDDSGSAVVVKAHAVPLDRLLRTVAGDLHHTVIDETGLAPNAVFDFELRWSSDGRTALAADLDAPSLSRALEEQLGLHLESGRGPVPMLVVEAVERPAAN